MEEFVKAPGPISLTPHKVSVCVLLQVYAGPGQVSAPYPFSTVSQHNRLGLFLLSLTKSSDDIVEPKLEELIKQLRVIGGPAADWLHDHLATKLSSLSTPDDLFNFFAEVRSILAGVDNGVIDDDQIILDPNSSLGIFLRQCLLAFNHLSLSFEGVCHLLTNIGLYCKEVLSGRSPYEAELDESCHDLEGTSDYENMDLEKFVYEKVTEEIEAKRRAGEKFSFHLHVPESIVRLVEDFEMSAKIKFKESCQVKEASPFVSCIDDSLKDVDVVFPRSNWQIQGYLAGQADAIEKHGSSFSLNAFELLLRQLEKLAPELQRVHFMRYLNSLYHEDYPAAVENLRKYFDYSAGREGLDIPSSIAMNDHGSFELASLCLGMVHFHFGHPKQGLEVLAEAVQVSLKNNNDSCLAYTLAAICSVLSDIGVSGTTLLLGSSSSPIASIGPSFSVQQLYVLLRESLKRAESLNLKRLVAFNHLTLAKIHLMHVQRPLMSFGSKASLKLKTCPLNVCKELRLSSTLIADFVGENSMMTTDGALSTMWLKSLQKPVASSVFIEESGLGNRSGESSFIAQPSSVPGSVLQLMGSSYLVRATAWEIYGSAPLARIDALTFATFFADHSSSADAALAYGKLIMHLATHKGYKVAFAALNRVEDRFLSVAKSQMLIVKLQLLHDHALHGGNLKVAQHLCDELGALASIVTDVDMDIKTEAGLRHARTLLAAKQFSQAVAVANSVSCMCYKFNLHAQNANALLLLAEIHKKSGNAVLGLPYVLASLSFCQSFNLDLLKASASLTLAELWLSLGTSHTKRALSLIHCALPMILGHGGLELRARAYIAEAKCYLSDSSFSVSEDPETVLESLTQALEELQLLEYHELQAEAFYLTAITYNKLGRFDEREEAAASFRIHITALENPEAELNHCRT